MMTSAYHCTAADDVDDDDAVKTWQSLCAVPPASLGELSVDELHDLDIAEICCKGTCSHSSANFLNIITSKITRRIRRPSNDILCGS